MPKSKTCVIVPWVTEKESIAFLEAWGVGFMPPWLLMQQDAKREGCGITKNKAIYRSVDLGYEVVVVLDGDCYPSAEARTLEELVEKHLEALEPQPVQLFQAVTSPPSRGTPFAIRSISMPVAASMGYWAKVPDYCAVRQLAFDCGPMDYTRETIYGRYFPLCGMNLAFRPLEWLPWCQFIDVDRFDDIWMGWLWQKQAYETRHCFNLNGPMITHSRQSNVWRNLRQESIHLEENEILWQKIALSRETNYDALRKLLPI